MFQQGIAGDFYLHRAPLFGARRDDQQFETHPEKSRVLLQA
jgi:hypothetical protein